MDIKIIDRRVDQALAMNKRAQTIIVLMACGIFLLGVGIIVVGFWKQNLYISTGALVLQGLLYWPIKQTARLRRENIVLMVLPVMATALSEKVAEEQFVKTLESLRK